MFLVKSHLLASVSNVRVINHPVPWGKHHKPLCVQCPCDKPSLYKRLMMFLVKSHLLASVSNVRVINHPVPWGKHHNTQFPLRLAYCMTYNKSQSQTLDRVLLDCTTEPFAHGHLYVALSRVRHYKNIRLFTKKLNLHENPNKQSNKIDSLMPTITNIVHRKVLLHNI